MKIWSHVRSEYIDKWVSEVAGKWGAAVRGNSALKEAVVRSFSDEVGESSPMVFYSAEIMWDISEFYDSLDTLLVLQEGMRLRKVSLLFPDPPREVGLRWC